MGFAKSDKDGAFQFASLPRIPLVLICRVSQGPYAEWTGPLPVDTETITLQLLRTRPFRITVLDWHGSPVPDVRVHVEWIGDGGSHTHRGASTGPDGVASLAGVSPTHPLVVHVLTEGRKPPVPGFKRRNVAFREGQMTVRLEAGSRIQGHVVDADGNAVGGGEVHAETTSPDGTTRTAKATPDKRTGAFTLAVAPGTYRVWVENCGDCAPSAPVSVRAPEDTLRIVAPRLATARGTLHAEDPESWHIEWFIEPRSGTAKIDAQGNFTISYIREEPANLLATRIGDSRVALLENVQPSDGPFEVRPVKGQRISGRVEGLEKASPRNTAVTVRRGLVYRFAPVQSDFTFSIDMPPGTWRLELSQGHERLAVQDVEAGTTDVLLVVRK